MNTSTADVERQCKLSYQIRISQHACLRAKERLHWTKQTILRMANRALELGLAPGNSGGSLKFFLFGKALPEQRSCPFLYGENIYVFALDETVDGVVLLTVYRAPRQLLQALVNKTQCRKAHPFHGEN